MTVELSDINSFFFDLDKTIWNWDSTIIGAEDLMHTIREKNGKHRFHTDNTLMSRQGYAEKLSSMNIPAEKNDILTSGYVAARKAASDGHNRVYAIGESGLMEELEENGLKVSQEAEAVVAGFDRQFNYEKLRKAMKILKDGGKLYICSTEKTLRKKNGEQPHQEPFNRALKTYAEDFELVGKPSKAFRNEFKDYFTYISTDAVLIGDRAEDIETGNKLGMRTGAVMSGDLNRKKIARADPDREPDFGLSNLNRLKRRIL